MDVPLELLFGYQAKRGGSGAVSAPGVEINELDFPHRQKFSHSLRRADNRFLECGSKAAALGFQRTAAGGATALHSGHPGFQSLEMA